MLTIWGRPNSLNVQKVLWLASELNIEYENIPAGGSYGGLDRPEFLSMNPHGHVPVIDDNGFIVWESHTILRYLAAKYAKGTFWPEDPENISLVDRWMDWTQTSLQPDFINGVFWGFYRTPEKQRNWPDIHKNIARCAEHFKLLNRLLDGSTYMLGNTLSLADMTIGSMLFRYFELDISRPSVVHVESWYARLQTHPAYRQHVMIPFDELRERLAF